MLGPGGMLPLPTAFSSYVLRPPASGVQEKRARLMWWAIASVPALLLFFAMTAGTEQGISGVQFSEIGKFIAACLLALLAVVNDEGPDCR